MTELTTETWVTKVKGNGYYEVVDFQDTWQATAPYRNAKLIAAVPDLVAACKAALAFTSALPIDDTVAGIEEILLAAINRAEGRDD